MAQPFSVNFGEENLGFEGQRVLQLKQPKRSFVHTLTVDQLQKPSRVPPLQLAGGTISTSEQTSLSGAAFNKPQSAHMEVGGAGMCSAFSHSAAQRMFHINM